MAKLILEMVVAAVNYIDKDTRCLRLENTNGPKAQLEITGDEELSAFFKGDNAELVGSECLVEVEPPRRARPQGAGDPTPAGASVLGGVGADGNGASAEPTDSGEAPPAELEASPDGADAPTSDSVDGGPREEASSS